VDVSHAVKLGVKGILVASGITNAKNPEKALVQLIKGLKITTR
jgi:thiamine monophosphate synthase